MNKLFLLPPTCKRPLLRPAKGESCSVEAGCALPARAGEALRAVILNRPEPEPLRKGRARLGMKITGLMEKRIKRYPVAPRRYVCPITQNELGANAIQAQNELYE